MQKVLLTAQIREYADCLDERVIGYIAEGQTETFEGFEDFDLMAFDWYDVNSDETGVSKMLIYTDREDLFIFCGDRRAYDKAGALLVPEQTNERALYLFLVGLLKDDMNRLELMEADVTDAEDAALNGSRMDFLSKIRDYHRELLRLKRYYEQLSVIMDNLIANDSELFSAQGVRRFAIVGNRVERFRLSVDHLRDHVTQMREARQAQSDLEQNNLMRVFTVITAVFLPLTLIVGWYGMNFTHMPELAWRYGYPAVAVLSAAVCVGLILWFKHRRWF